MEMAAPDTGGPGGGFIAELQIRIQDPKGVSVKAQARTAMEASFA